MLLTILFSLLLNASEEVPVLVPHATSIIEGEAPNCDFIATKNEFVEESFQRLRFLNQELLKYSPRRFKGESRFKRWNARQKFKKARKEHRDLLSQFSIMAWQEEVETSLVAKSTYLNYGLSEYGIHLPGHLNHYFDDHWQAGILSWLEEEEQIVITFKISPLAYCMNQIN